MRKTKALQKTLFPLISTVLLAFLTLGVSAADYYPPRVSFIDGTAAYEPAGDVDWDEVTLNLPLLSGDRIFSQLGSRVEIELGNSNFIRLGSETDIVFNQIDRKLLVLELHTGAVILRLNRNQRIDLYTPYGRIELKQDGLYRISADPQTESRLIVRKGRADFEGASGRVRVTEGQQLRLDAQQGYQQVSYGTHTDEFDLWSDRRDARFVHSQSVSHVGGTYYPGIYDLDYYGNWAYYPSYGRVWIPNVSVGWAPFRFGRWGYLSFGWTWISHEPWGWLPYHHGNWIYHRSRWCWVPGGFNSWSPAVVNFYFGNGWVGWAPRGYYGRNRYVNNNTVIVNNNRTVINNWNGNGPGNGLTVVSRNDFSRGRTRVDKVLHTPTREMVRTLQPGLPDDLSRGRTNRVAVSGDAATRVRSNRTTLPTTGDRTATVRSRSPSETSPRARGNALTPNGDSRSTTIRTRPGSTASPPRTERSTTNRDRSPGDRVGTGILPRAPQTSPTRRAVTPRTEEPNRGTIRTVPSPARSQTQGNDRWSRPSTIRTAPTPPRNNTRTVRPSTPSWNSRPSVTNPGPRTSVPRAVERPTPSRRTPSVRSTPNRSSSRPSVSRPAPSGRSAPTISSRPSPRPSYRSAPSTSSRPSVTRPSRTSRPSSSSKPAPRRRPD